MTEVDETGAARTLMPGHLRELQESCITPDVIAARGYETLYGTDEDKARLKELRIPRWAWRDDLAFPALLLPMYRVTGEEIGFQFKPATPQEAPGGKRQKYASQSGTPNRLDVPPAVSDAVRDPSVPLWVTEGIKKADCLASHGKAVLTLTGVFNWRSKLGTLGDWEDVPLQGRTVVICFDADAREKRTVMLAMQRLGRWLESKGARPMYLIVPAEVEREDASRVPVKGVDDFLHAGGTMDGLKDACMAQLPTGSQDAAFSDAVLTDTLVNEALDGRFRWSRGLGWMEWSGKVWREASDATVLEAIRQWALEQFNRVLDEQRRDASRDMQSQMEGWRSTLSTAKLSNLMKLSRGPLECSAADFDADPDLLNCPNGIVDLRSGVLTPHDPDQLMTKMAGADFVKSARHPDWDLALESVPEDVRDWYQIRVGQAATGHMTPDDLILILQGGGSNGKALDVATPMLTANRGWTTMGGLKEGDEVYGPDGQPTKVTHAFGVLHGRTCYRVTTSDGRSVVADADHLWTVRLSKGTSKLNLPRWVTLTTQQMVDRGVTVAWRDRPEYRFRLPVQQSVQAPEADLPLDPYVLGAWLGDGSSEGSRFTCHPDDMQIMDEIRAAGIPVRKTGKSPLSWTLGDGTHRKDGTAVSARLRALGVLGGKHVPEAYLTASAGQRLALLQGLMDTDGFASAGQGQAEFCTTRRTLADAVLYLARSLGWKATVKEGRATLDGRDCGPKWRVMWTPGPDGMIPFRLKRKADRIRASRSRIRPTEPSIVSIERVESRPVRCITVDRDDALYLAGRDLVPTHNSTVYDVCAMVLGKYHVQVSDRVILGAASDNHPTEIMDLLGARYAVLEETPEARRLDTNRAKKLAGTREITGRRIRQDPVTFEATHSLFINSNHKPLVDETDHGTWRRLALMVWPHTYRKRQEDLRGPNDRLGDPTLRLRLKEDPQAREAALAWIAEGARRWYEMDRIMPPVPERVEEDTLAWRKESDPVLSFADEHLQFDLDACIAGQELRSVFNEWLVKVKGAREWGDKTFLARFQGHDAMTTHSVVYKVVKNPQRLSSREGGEGPKTGTVRAWLGLKWATGGDDSGEGNEEVKDPFGGGDTKIGYSGYTSPVNGKIPYRIAVNFGSVTGVTGPESASETISDPAPEEYPDDPFAEADPEPSPAPSLPVLRGAVGWDLETPSAKQLFTFRSDEAAPYARLCGVVDEDGQRVIVNSPEELITLLERAPVIHAHNGFRFDLMALAWHHGADYDRLAAKLWDTYVDATVLDPPGAKGQKPWANEGYYGLDQVAERLGLPGKTDRLPELAKEFASPGLTGREAEEDGYGRIPVDNERYRSYLMGDLGAQQSVGQRMLSVPERMDYRRREQRVAHIQNRMTLSGWKVDVPLLDRLVREEQDKVAESLAWLHENAGVPLTETRTRGRRAAKETYEVPRKSPLGSNAGKEALIRAFAERGAYSVPRTESGVLALNKDALGEGSYMVGKGGRGQLRPGMLNPRVLATFADRGADVEAIRELCDHIKLVTTSVQKYAEIQQHLIGDRVHAHVGETQGSRRWAMVKPSVTNMGKRGGKVAQRAPMIADDGCVLIAFDFDQVDMRAFAGHCGDPAYVGMFVRDEDPHSMIADMVFGRHDGEWRERAKASGHGWNYGLSVNGLVNSGIERELAERFDAGMNEGYPVLCSWRSDVRAQGEAGQLLDNGFGALMRCDPHRAYTQAPALMGQGTARDIMCEGLLRLPEEYIPWLRGVVHDEAVLSVPEDRVEECIATVTAAFTMDLAEITGGRLTSVPIKAGASRPGHNWAACYAKD